VNRLKIKNSARGILAPLFKKNLPDSRNLVVIFIFWSVPQWLYLSKILVELLGEPLSIAEKTESGIDKEHLSLDRAPGAVTG
jgi:hypothetical protein